MRIAGLSTPCLRREEIKAGIRVIRGAGRVTILTSLVNNPEFIHVMLMSGPAGGVNFIPSGARYALIIRVLLCV